MRVLQVNKFYDPRGGTERVLFDLEDGLRERGHEVAVFACRHPDNRPSVWSDYFAADRDYAGGSWRQRISHAAGTLYDGAARARFARILDAFAPDVVHFHNIYHQLSPSLLDEVAERALPSVMTLHDYKLVCPVYRLYREGAPCTKCVGTRWPGWVGVHRCSRGSTAESWLLAVESTFHRQRRSYERAIARFLCPSAFLAERMREGGLPPSRLVVLRNAPRHRPAVASPELRDAVPTLLYAGRLSEEKGVDLLVEAARAVPAVQLRIAGDGPEAEALRRLAEGLANVHWLGRLEAAGLDRERARAWAVVVPSRWWENAPLTVLEACAAGRPVLAADHGGLTEMVDHGLNGWRVPAGVAAAWAEAFARVRGARDELGLLGAKALAWVESTHDFGRFLDRHESIYAEVSSGSAGGTQDSPQRRR